jgi:hypothetical protein
MSATRPLQNTLNDVIGVGSDSRKVDGCSVSLVAALRLSRTMGTSGSIGSNGQQPDGRCTSIEGALGELGCVRFAVLMYRSAWVSHLGSTTDPKLSSVAVYSIDFKLAILKVEKIT